MPFCTWMGSKPMPRYRVEHRYASSTYGPWVEGDHVEMSADEAAWVNHDSEGTLKVVDPQEQARQKREAQEKTERNRVASTKLTPGQTPPPPAPPAAEPPAAPAPKRRGRPPGSTTRKAT